VGERGGGRRHNKEAKACFCPVKDFIFCVYFCEYLFSGVTLHAKSDNLRRTPPLSLSLYKREWPRFELGTSLGQAGPLTTRGPVQENEDSREAHYCH
jgi:hypothetical protein